MKQNAPECARDNILFSHFLAQHFLRGIILVLPLTWTTPCYNNLNFYEAIPVFHHVTSFGDFAGYTQIISAFIFCMKSSEGERMNAWHLLTIEQVALNQDIDTMIIPS